MRAAVLLFLGAAPSFAQATTSFAPARFQEEFQAPLDRACAARTFDADGLVDEVSPTAEDDRPAIAQACARLAAVLSEISGVAGEPALPSAPARALKTRLTRAAGASEALQREVEACRTGCDEDAALGAAASLHVVASELQGAQLEASTIEEVRAAVRDARLSERADYLRELDRLRASKTAGTEGLADRIAAHEKKRALLAGALTRDELAGVDAAWKGLLDAVSKR